MQNKEQFQQQVMPTNNSQVKGPAQPAPGSPPPNLGHNGNGARNSNGNMKDSSSSSLSDVKGPAQPAPGAPPPNLGHNGNGAVNSNGNIRGNQNR